MGNRSNINLVGNTTQGQNIGVGDDVYKGKALGYTLQFKTLSVTGTTMIITSDDNNIYFSANTGGGGGTVISGTACRVPVFNTAGDNVEDTTLSFESHLLCNSDSLCVRVPDTKNIYLDAPLVASDKGQVFLGAPDTHVDVDEQWLCAAGSATNIKMNISSKGSGYINFSAPTTYIGSVGVTGWQLLTSTGTLSLPHSPIISTRTGTASIPDGTHMCIVGSCAYAQSGYDGSGGDICICGGCACCNCAAGTGDGGSVSIQSGPGIGSGVAGRVAFVNLPVKSSETCGLYIDVSGNLSTGVISGGTDAFAALTSNSSVAWDTSAGLNKTWSIDGSYTLTLNNLASGMYGTVKVTVTAGTPTITLAGATFKGNGSLAALANGTYMLAWVASSGSTVEWNIALYA